MEKRKTPKQVAIVILLIITMLTGLTACKDSAEERVAERIPVLAYHKIVPSDHEFTSSLLISEDTFDKQMKYLHDHGYTTITPDELSDWYDGKDLPEKSVMITFDDGYYGTYYLAYPIIKKYDQAATVFCIGHHIEETTHEWEPDADEDYRIGADVIESMRTEYPRFCFESHTYDMHQKVNGKHPVDVYTYDQMKEDVDKMEKYGFRYLAYPWGDYNDTIKKVLADSGYKLAFDYNPFYYATRNDDRYAVNRIKISGKMKMKKFKKIVSGKHEDYINPDE